MLYARSCSLDHNHFNMTGWGEDIVISKLKYSRGNREKVKACTNGLFNIAFVVVTGKEGMLLAKVLGVEEI